MTTSERKSRKIYYTMGEVSEMFDVNPSLIRFWEQKFDILKPDKNKKGNRLFTPKDVENLKLIYYLPALLIAGTVTGFVMGMISKKLLPIVKRESEREAQIG